MKSDCGKCLQDLLKGTTKLKKLQIDFNELMVQGAQCVAKGLSRNNSLESLNIKGNVIGDQGLVYLAQALVASNNRIKELDISLNEIGPQGF